MRQTLDDQRRTPQGCIPFANPDNAHPKAQYRVRDTTRPAQPIYIDDRNGPGGHFEIWHPWPQRGLSHMKGRYKTEAIAKAAAAIFNKKHGLEPREGN